MSQTPPFHEDLRSHHAMHVPSERAFGLTLGVVLVIIGLLHFLLFGGWFSLFFLALGAAAGGIALVKSEWMVPVKNIFLKLAPKISAVITPVIMAFLFAVCFIPGAMILRIFGKNLIENQPDPYRITYWVKREPTGLQDPMKYQF